MKRFWFLILFLFPFYVSAETLSWVGCGISKKAFMADLSEAWSNKTGHQINLQGGGATKGIREVAANHADMGGTCRHRIDGAEEERSAVFEPVAWDALVVIVHPDNPVSDISRLQLRDVYLGKITNWKDLGGPDQPIRLFARRGKISGVGRTVRKLLFANFDQDFVTDNLFPSTGPLEKSLENDPLAIAITGISSAKKRHVKILQLEGKEPNYTTIQRGEYLLYRPLYITYNDLGGQKELILNFIRFAQSKEGRKIIRNNGVVPYVDALALIMKQLNQERDAREMGLYRKE